MQYLCGMSTETSNIPVNLCEGKPSYLVFGLWVLITGTGKKVLVQKVPVKNYPEKNTRKKVPDF